MPNLTHVDLQFHPNLKKVFISSSSITEFVLQNSKIEQLNLPNNRLLTSVKLVGNNSMELLNLASSKVSKLIVKNPLRQFNFDNSMISSRFYLNRDIPEVIQTRIVPSFLNSVQTVHVDASVPEDRFFELFYEKLFAPRLGLRAHAVVNGEKNSYDLDDYWHGRSEENDRYVYYEEVVKRKRSSPTKMQLLLDQ